MNAGVSIDELSNKSKVMAKKKKRDRNRNEKDVSIKKFANIFMNDFLKKSTPGFSSVNKYFNKNYNAKIKSSDLIYFEQESEKVPTSIQVNGIEEDSYINLNFRNPRNGRKKILDLYDVTSNNEKKLLVTSDFETKHSVPIKQSLRSLRKQRKEKSLETAGDEWFNMKPPEIDADIKRDFDILQMRSVLDPKRFYKSNDREILPRYFQVGKVMDNAADFYSTRIPKKQRKPTLADELLADAKFQKYRRKKMVELIAKRQAATGKIIKKKRKLKN